MARSPTHDRVVRSPWALAGVIQDHVNEDDTTLRERWERYIDARKEALAARSRRPSAAQHGSPDPDAPSGDAPIARILHLVPRPRSGQ
jgi:hypothetical protein